MTSDFPITHMLKNHEKKFWPQKIIFEPPQTNLKFSNLHYTVCQFSKLFDFNVLQLKMTVAMSRFQKYIVCGVFYILYWWYGSKRGQNCPILENGKITDSLNISKMMLFRNTLMSILQRSSFVVVLFCSSEPICSWYLLIVEPSISDIASLPS